MWTLIFLLICLITDLYALMSVVSLSVVALVPSVSSDDVMVFFLVLSGLICLGGIVLSGGVLAEIVLHAGVLESSGLVSSGIAVDR